MGVLLQVDHVEYELDDQYDFDEVRNELFRHLNGMSHWTLSQGGEIHVRWSGVGVVTVRPGYVQPPPTRIH